MADEGATPRELILEACRRNNVSLLEEVISTTKPTSSSSQTAEEAVAALLNAARDGMGNAALHIAASSGSYEVLDLLLDQPGLETDPLDRQEGGTPLHKAVSLCNSLPSTAANAKPPSAASDSGDLESFLAANEGHCVVEILLDAGCDPRTRNKGKMKAVDLVDPRNTVLRGFLRRAEIMLMEGESGVVGADEVAEDDAEAKRDGPGSESD